MPFFLSFSLPRSRNEQRLELVFHVIISIIIIIIIKQSRKGIQAVSHLPSPGRVPRASPEGA